jgi:hypothetical protein
MQNAGCSMLPIRVVCVPGGAAAAAGVSSERAADGLVSGGKMGLFTPLFFFLVRKHH